jgi:hypothetical protein
LDTEETKEISPDLSFLVRVIGAPTASTSASASAPRFLGFEMEDKV